MKSYKTSFWVLILYFFVFSNILAQGTWKQCDDFGGNPRSNAAGFSIGKKGYIGTGFQFKTGNISSYNDFWEYNPDSNQWKRIAAPDSNGSSGDIGFSIGNKGYVGSGMLNKFYEYDPSSNIWTQKANTPGLIREFAVGFNIGNKGYFGLGQNLSVKGHCLKDFWEYDPSTNEWSLRDSFPGSPRYGAVGFSIGDKGYIGTGSDSSGNYVNDFWEYDPKADKWTKKASFDSIGRIAAIAFSIEGKGFIGLGSSKYYGLQHDLWEYDTTSDSWSQVADCDPGYNGYSGVYFSIGNKGYAGTGSGPYLTSAYNNAFWAYTPHSTGIETDKIQDGFSVFPNPGTGDFRVFSPAGILSCVVFNINGKVVSEEILANPSDSLKIHISGAKGLYFVKIRSKTGTQVGKIIAN